MSATYSVDGSGVTVELAFPVPRVLVTASTHVVLEDDTDGDGDATARLKVALADVTRELCRRTVQQDLDANQVGDNVMSPNIDTNCETYTPESMTVIAPDDTVEVTIPPDTSSAPIQLHSVCHGLDFYQFEDPVDTDGGDGPAHPLQRTVACQCEVEMVGSCGGPGALIPQNSVRTISDHFCVPDMELPADYCREDVADFFNASVRWINDSSNALSTGSCENSGPDELDVIVRCAPVDMSGLDPMDGPRGCP